MKHNKHHTVLWLAFCSSANHTVTFSYTKASIFQVKHVGSNCTWVEHFQLLSALWGALTAESVSCQSHSGAERSRLQKKNKWAPGGRLLPDYITEDDLTQGHSAMRCTLYRYLHWGSYFSYSTAHVSPHQLILICQEISYKETWVSLNLF